MKLKCVCKTFEEAMSIHKKMFMMLREKEYVTCNEFITLTGYYNEEFSDSKYNFWGWYNLQDLKVEQDENENWYIETPEIVEIV